MNPRAVLLIVVVAALVLAAIIGLGYWIAARNAGVRRREYAAMQAERDAAWQALADIEDATLTYTDLDSPLAATIRTVLRWHATQKMGIKR